MLPKGFYPFLIFFYGLFIIRAISPIACNIARLSILRADRLQLGQKAEGSVSQRALPPLFLQQGVCHALQVIRHGLTRCGTITA